MNQRYLFNRVLIPVVLLLFSGFADASIVLSNLGATHSDTVCKTTADSFTTDSNGDYTLASVTYTLVDTGSVLALSLYSDNSGEPGSVISAIETKTLGSTGNDVNYTFLPTSTIVLASNTTYWLVAESTTCSNALAASGDVPVGRFTYNGGKIATGYDIVTSKYLWGATTAQSRIFEIAVEGGSFDIETSATNAQSTKNFTYSFCFQNSNTADATVTLMSGIPTGSTFVSATGSYSTTPTTITWNISPVVAGGAAKCVDLVVNVTAPVGDSLVLNAMFTSDQPFVPDHRTVTTTVIAPRSGSFGGGGSMGWLQLLAALLMICIRTIRK